MSHMKRSIEATHTAPPTPSTIALRCVGSELVELPITPCLSAAPWIAILRPAPETSDRWARLIWEPTVGRGWIIPSAFTFGSLVEFGADIPQRRNRPSAHRWYGIAVAREPHWLVVHGSFDGPDGAAREAHDWLTDQRRDAAVRNNPQQRTAG